ncbi:MAG: hypothetical protein ILA34_02445, partial [Bacteroidaceae bacterium]|nr:hypothetical protein [Bacteroidaceae bacterium]
KFCAKVHNIFITPNKMSVFLTEKVNFARNRAAELPVCALCGVLLLLWETAGAIKYCTAVSQKTLRCKLQSL